MAEIILPKLLSDAELLAEMQRNCDVQDANRFDSDASRNARIANRPLFSEATRRNLKGQIT